MLTFGNKLNRLYTLYLPFLEDHCEIGVFFNKSNSFVGFNLDQTNYVKSRNGNIKCFIFNDLNKSAFATSFLELKDFRSKNLDIKQQFNNILPEFRDRIHYETNETIKLSKIQIKEKTFESCLFVYVFKFIDFGNNFLFALAERQHIDVSLNKKIVRTAGIQLCTNERFEELTEMVEIYNKNIITKNRDSDVNNVVSNVFEDRKNLNEMKI